MEDSSDKMASIPWASSSCSVGAVFAAASCWCPGSGPGIAGGIDDNEDGDDTTTFGSMFGMSRVREVSSVSPGQVFFFFFVLLLPHTVLVVVLVVVAVDGVVNAGGLEDGELCGLVHGNNKRGLSMTVSSSTVVVSSSWSDRKS